MCLAIYKIKNFKFFLGMNIWYDILFVINSVNKVLQSKNMDIEVVINHLRGLISYFKNYTESSFGLALKSTTKLVIEIDI
uniref:Uncharacterized protein n=1 Tax=Cajanus cajan TaxID=3821 RepID=A0A151S8M3_CAJCA|nr:hypothetical protein KK1_026968 [Cajanus cajan]